MKNRCIGMLLGSFLLCGQAFSQSVQRSGWFASFNTIKLAPKWGLHAELQVRSTDKLKQVQTVLPRVGLNYQVGKNQIITVGYAYIPNRATIGGYSSLLGEHRIWQQYIINQKLGKPTLQHRLRLEERFTPKAVLAAGSIKVAERVYSTRLRYFARAIVPFSKAPVFTKGVFLALQNELFANITNNKNANGRFFDQNRAYVALGYRISKKFDVEAGYMNQYVQRAATTTNLANHIGQLATYLRL